MSAGQGGRTEVTASKFSGNSLTMYGTNSLSCSEDSIRTGIVEMRSIGTLRKDSGWTSAICEANVASSGTAESFLIASSITRTRQSHQITACNLHNLMNIRRTKTTAQTNQEAHHWALKTGESAVPVLESGVKYGAGHIYSDPFFQIRKL